MHIYYILDKSGSMKSRVDKVISGMNEFIEDQKKVGDCRVNLYSFNSKIETIFEDKNISEVEFLTPERYDPNGPTALLDAMGYVLQKIPLDQKSILIILTDGEENSSYKYTSVSILEMIESRKNNLEIVYMGSNQDAILNGARIGVNCRSSLVYNDLNLPEAMRCTSAAVKRYRSQETQGIEYTEEERQKSA